MIERSVNSVLRGVRPRWRRRVGRAIATAAVALAACWYVSMASGFTLQLHIFAETHDHEQEHDSQNCSICGELTLTAKGCPSAIDLPWGFSVQFSHFSILYTSVVVDSHDGEAANPRGPPAVTV